LTGKN